VLELNQESSPLHSNYGKLQNHETLAQLGFGLPLYYVQLCLAELFVRES
jgi:hypothetical protein